MVMELLFIFLAMLVFLMAKKATNFALRPLAGSFRTLLHPGVYLNRKGLYAKDYNKLTNSRYVGFRTVKEAHSHAVFLAELRNNGFFHPDTLFIVAANRRKKPTVVALMPFLRPTRWPLVRVRKRFKAIFESVLAKHLLKKEVPELHTDLDYLFNYGKGGNGRVYYRDLHVLSFTPSPAVMTWHKLKKAAEK